MADIEAITHEALGTWLQCVPVSFGDDANAEEEMDQYADEQFSPEDVDNSTTAQFVEWGAGLAAIAGDHGVVIADNDLGEHLGMSVARVGDPLCFRLTEDYPDAPPQMFEKMDEYLESSIRGDLSAVAYRDKTGKLKIAAE